MRSSNKSRSRNKNNNRNRSMGNIVNRVFDSAGPEGKVRGTPQQIIEKYTLLTRDAQLAGDRVAAENFQQHAEHYTRMLDEAMREQAERQAEQQQRQQNQQGGQDNSGGGNGNANGNANTDGNRGRRRDNEPKGIETITDESGDSNDSGLVETPENSEKPAEEPKPRARRPRNRAKAEDVQPQPAGDAGAAEAAAE